MPKTVEFSLVPHETDEGRGYVLERDDGQRMRWERLEEENDGVLSFYVAGVSHRADALDRPEFSPGKVLALVPEPENPYDENAIGVWDRERRYQIGYVPKQLTRRVRGADIDCKAVWEMSTDGTRTALRVVAYDGDRYMLIPPLNPLSTAQPSPAPNIESGLDDATIRKIVMVILFLIALLVVWIL